MRRLPFAAAALGIATIVPAAVINAVLDWPGTVDLIANLGFTLLVVGAAGTGAIVASRVPGNAVGWTLLALGAGLGVAMLCGAYAEWSALRSASPLPGEAWAAWVGSWLALLAIFAPATALLLLFPDGRLVSPRWRPVAWALVAVVVLGVAGVAFSPEPIGEGKIANPLAADERLADIAAVTDLLALPALLTAAASLAVRFRRSRGVERLQLKWFAFDGAIVGVALGLSGSVGGLIADLAFVTGLLSLAALPVTAGLAILRYRLYDIDVVIRRTLIYAALTAALAATYLALVLLIGLAVGRSGFAVAVSTLAVATLFRPLRKRIQAGVDRRFYRRRYDAALTLEAFGGRLRDEVDLEALTADVRGVVRETMQPASVTLWLRSER